MKWWVIALTASAVFAQTVDVTVLNVDGSAPIGDVKVELAQNGSAMRRGWTDTQGVFRFEAVADGDYTVELTKQGYRHLNDRARRSIHVGVSGTPVRVEERMLRLGQLSGRVFGGGKPIAAADVQLFLSGNFIGQVVRTNAKGEFEFHDVDPGTYVLSARATRASPLAPVEDDGRKLGWVRTWYPSAPDSSGAAKLVVAPGADLFGQDILLRTVPVHRVSGRVLSTAGEPMSGVVVKAAPPEEFATAEFELETKSGEDGRFEFPGVPDGGWRLTAQSKAGGVDLYAAIGQTVAGRDIDRAELRFVPPFTLEGKVVRTATGMPSEKKPMGVMLGSSVGGSRLSWGPVKDDGSFRIENLPPGIYRFQPTSPGPPYYLASIEMNGRDVLGEWVEITAGTLPVTIAYRADSGTVRGTVEDCGGATVVLAPQVPALQYSEFIRQTPCTQGGRFEITGLRPGEYYVFAFDKPIGMLELSTFARQWISQAVRVTVRAGEASDALLKVTQRGPY